MRVIAGHLRGRSISVPAGRSVRPTPAKVRGAIFDILADRVGDALVLDLFSGSGALSIEALSRGARGAVLIDNDPLALGCARQNLITLGLDDRAQCLRRRLPEQLARGHLGRFDLVFSDPPYAKDPLAGLAEALQGAQLLAPEAIWVHEYSSQRTVPALRGFELADNRRYGDTQIALLRPSEVPA